MKFINNLFIKIWSFFYYLTPKRRKEKYWKQAECNLENHFYEKGVKEIDIKKDCVNYAKKLIKKKKLSDYHLAKITSEKYKDELADVGVKIDYKTLQFKDA